MESRLVLSINRGCVRPVWRYDKNKEAVWVGPPGHGVVVSLVPKNVSEILCEIRNK